MLSICIPIYNTNVVPLVRELHRQCSQCVIDFEIIGIDDASPFLKEENRTLDSFKEVLYIELAQNIGRAAIRNLLAEKASFQTLLYLDSDVSIEKYDFIKNYISSTISKTPVVVGGISYPKKNIDQKTALHFRYGAQREVQSIAKRSKNPYSSFLTGNLLIQKRLVEQIQFLSSLKEYGHEDTLFCQELKNRSIPISHIDNPVVHEGLERNDIFVRKHLTAIRNLCYIIEKGYSMENAPVYKVYLKLKKYRLIGFYILSFGIVRPIMEKLLLSGRMNWLFIFDLVRLHELAVCLDKSGKRSQRLL